MVNESLRLLRNCSISPDPGEEFVAALALALLYDADARSGLLATMDLHARILRQLQRIEATK